MSSVNVQISQILLDASSSNAETRRIADAKLKEWEKTPNFYPTLLEMTFDNSIDIHARSLSIIYMKNGIEKYWRKSSPCCLPPEEKSRIRQTILKTFEEENNALARQLDVAIAKIGRIDYPNDWPNLIEIILQAIKMYDIDPNPKNRLISYRGLTLLNQVIKSLSSSRISRKINAIAPELLSNTVSQFINNINQFITKFTENSSNEADIRYNLEFALYALKCIRKIIVFGYNHNNITPDSDPIKFLNILLEYMIKLFSIYQTLKDSSPYTELLLRIIKGCGKAFINIQTNNPVQFTLMERCPEVVSWYWDKINTYDRKTCNIDYEIVIVQGMEIITHLVKNPDLVPTSRAEAEQNEDLKKIDNILRNVIFIPTFVEALSEVLIFKYLSFSENELSNWEFSPETFVCDEDSPSCESQLRICAETLFLNLFSSYSEIIAPKILVYVQKASEITDKASKDDILLKDAIYSTIGLGANNFSEIIDFDSWFLNNLLQEGLNKSPNFVIIRRRISWLISKWISVKVSKEIRPKIYELLISLLVPEEDLVIRLTTINTVHSCVDDWEFELDSYLPYNEAIIDLCLRLIFETTEFDCKIKIINCLSVIVERMGTKVVVCAEKIINILPQLWDSSGEEQYTFKSAIIVILTKFVIALRQDSMQIYNITIPIIKKCLDTSTKSQYYFFIEDILELWQGIVQNATECSPELLSLFQPLLTLYDYGTTLLTVIKITESYVVLAPDVIFQQYGIDLFNRLSEVIDHPKPEIVKHTVRIIDFSLQICHHNQCLPSIIEVMMNTPIFEKMLETIMKEKGYCLAIVDYLSIFARIMLCDANIFLNLMKHLGQKCEPPQDSILKPMLQTYVDRIDTIGHPRIRKLVGLALSNILPILNQDTIDQLQGIFVIMSDILIEVLDSGKKDLTVNWHDDNNIELEEESLDTIRRNELVKNDPINNINIFDFFKSKLSELETIAGGPQSFNDLILSHMDQMIVLQVQKLIQ
ncbi:ARM repeat-containing protein [Neocallimastix sp. 'constans']|jgi:hypothetical protein